MTVWYFLLQAAFLINAALAAYHGSVALTLISTLGWALSVTGMSLR